MEKTHTKIYSVIRSIWCEKKPIMVINPTASEDEIKGNKDKLYSFV